MTTNSLASTNFSDALFKLSKFIFIIEIGQNSISNFSTQLRNVTQDDYLVRALSMPSKFGIISKAWTQKPEADTANTSIRFICVIYNANNKLTTASERIKTKFKNIY